MPTLFCTTLGRLSQEKLVIQPVHSFPWIDIFYQGNTLVVQNDILEFVITLQNPYIFDLELEELSLRYVRELYQPKVNQLLPSTSGVSFKSKSIQVVIPAGTLHQVVLSGQATETGTLTIRGCFVQAPGGIAREYILPLYTVEEEERLARKRRTITSENGRSKYAGLKGCLSQKRSSTPTTELSAGTSTFRFLECKVVPDQPLLRIRRSSVTHGALMLYDGEKCASQPTLELLFNS